MCGRYVLYGPKTRLQEHFGLDACVDFPARYNIAPQSDILVVRAHPERGRVGVTHRWGLVPAWSKDPGIGARLTNARAETIAEKPAFRSSFRRLRCLVPANGFYEWQASTGSEGRKQPHYFSPPTEPFLALAGLVACWQATESERLLTVALITTAANATVAPVHERMPVLIPPQRFAAWLDPANGDAESLRALLGPAPAESLKVHPVGTAVNRSSNEGPELVAPRQS